MQEREKLLQEEVKEQKEGGGWKKARKEYEREKARKRAKAEKKQKRTKEKQIAAVFGGQTK